MNEHHCPYGACDICEPPGALPQPDHDYAQHLIINLQALEDGKSKHRLTREDWAYIYRAIVSHTYPEFIGPLDPNEPF